VNDGIFWLLEPGKHAKTYWSQAGIPEMGCEPCASRLPWFQSKADEIHAHPGLLALIESKFSKLLPSGFFGGD